MEHLRLAANEVNLAGSEAVRDESYRISRYATRRRSPFHILNQPVCRENESELVSAVRSAVEEEDPQLYTFYGESDPNPVEVRGGPYDSALASP